VEFVCGRQLQVAVEHTHHSSYTGSYEEDYGHGDAERVVAVRWTSADEFAEALLADSKLTQMLKEVMLREYEISVEPLDDHI
jgi:hypothetical protein